LIGPLLLSAVQKKKSYCLQADFEKVKACLIWKPVYKILLEICEANSQLIGN